MISLMKLSYEDHCALVKVGKLVKTDGSMKAYSNAWRELCGAMKSHAPYLLNEGIEKRICSETLKMLSDTLAHADPEALVSTLNNLGSCAKQLLGKNDAYRLVRAAGAAAREASGWNERRRAAYAAKRDRVSSGSQSNRTL